MARNAPKSNTGSKPVEDIRAERKRELALGYRIFASQRWGDIGDGHISARDPERTDCFWLLRYGVSFDEARIEDLVLVGPDGKLVEGDGDINISAYYIHQPIHDARPETVSAAHVHTPWGTPFAAERRPLLPITQEACLFFEDCALFDDDELQVQSTRCGERIAAALGDKCAVVLCNHGLLTASDSVSETVGLFVILERVAEAHMKARKAIPVNCEAARFSKADLVRKETGKTAFEWLVKRHLS